MAKLSLPRIRRVPDPVRKALEEYRKANPRPTSPCIDQTQEEIEHYYRNAGEGSTAAVRQTHGGLLKYTLCKIELRRSRTGRINVPEFGDFYMKSGKNCFHPTGQTMLVVPTDEVVRWASAHPMGEFGYTVYERDA